MKLDVKALAITCALLWGCALLFGTWWIILLDGPSSDPTFVSKVYRGYSVTPAGSLIGFAWGLLDGAFGGALLAWIYNRITATA
ncbi:MAG: hypothetical protein GY716_25615 [bacterium]|nr:hypothetical protein [bacterium]